MTNSLLLLVPMRSELFAVRLGAPRAAIERIGMGPARATRTQSSLMSRLDPDQEIVLLGVCGGLVPGLTPGDVVVASEISSLDTNETVQMQGADDIAAQLEGHRSQVRVAPIVSSSSILHGDDARAKASARGAVAVDMESYWCTPLLTRHRFSVVRVVLDVFGRRNISPAALHAGLKSFRSLAQVARVLADVRPSSISIQQPQKIGES